MPRRSYVTCEEVQETSIDIYGEYVFTLSYVCLTVSLRLTNVKRIV